MDKPKNQKETVASDNAYKYIPGTRTLTQHQDWSALKLDVFTFSTSLDEAPEIAIEDHAFSVVTGGKCEQTWCRLNGKKTFVDHLNPEHIVVLPRLNSISWQWSPSNQEHEEIQSNIVYLPEKILEDSALETLDLDHSNIEVLPKINHHRDDFLKEIVKQFAKDPDQTNPLNRVYFESLAQMFAIHVLRYYCATATIYKDYKSGLPRRTLSAVTDYIELHLNREIPLKDLAELSNLSAYYFIRMFKKSTGLSPHQYIVERRIARAKHLLKTSRLSILEIAIETGYKSASNFSSAFKKAIGITPSQFRH